MIPLHIIRSLTTNRRAQRIGDAIGVTNYDAGIAYLKGTAARVAIEHKAFLACNGLDKHQEGERWIEDCWSKTYAIKHRRKHK